MNHNETFFSAVFIALKFWVVVPYLTSYRGTTIPSDVCNIVYLHNTYLSYLFSCGLFNLIMIYNELKVKRNGE